MLTARDSIVNSLNTILKEVVGQDMTAQIELPADPSHGDYSSNIALVAAKTLKKDPMVLASEIREKLEKGGKLPEVVDKIEVAPPGFINFWLSQQYLVSQLRRVIKEKNSYGKGTLYRGKKIMLEFADPNPFKEFHIGHLRNISLGESYCRLLEALGATVWRVNYQGDVGLHVAKALWGMMELKGEVPSDNTPLSRKVAFLGRAYKLGATAYEQNEDKREEIQSINVKVYKKDPSILPLWRLGRKWSLRHFETIYKRVGTAYKRYYFESEVAEPGRKLALSHIDDGIFERHEGALVFRGKHTRVFVTKEDYATYEAKDLALASLKYQDFLYDSSIIITAHEQTPYFQVVLQALGRVAPKLAAKTRHFSFGFVSLKERKMSSRTGDVVTGEWLLDECKRRIQKEFSKMDDKTAEMVATGAAKYSMLKFSAPADIKFSFEESISLEGNSGPYLQYTFARTQSVLAKAKDETISKNITVGLKRGPLAKEEVVLLRMLHRFTEVVEEVAVNFAPNLLCNYLFDLAQKFNLFYQKHRILKSENAQFRLFLTSGVGQVIKNGLYLLGIATPERM